MLDYLFNPSSIAVVGASSVPDKVGNAVLSNLINGNYQGKIVPINPGSDEILGVKCYRSLPEYSEKVDMSVIAVPVRFVKSAVADSIAAGAKAVTVITAGFKEVNDEGARLEKEIADLCRSKRVRLLGPNVLGVMNTHNAMNATFANQMPQKGSISVISQSGAICAAILDWAVSRKLGLAKLVSLGNKADLNEIDMLEWLGDDDDTKVIVGYLESIVNGRQFIQTSERVTSKKPVILFKAGTTGAGAKAASSHTGSLAGADIAYGAAFKRSGVIRADSFEQLFDFAIALDMQPLPRGKSVAIVTNAGGPGIICADAVENSGMSVAQLDHQSATALKKKLPEAASIGNPIDVLGDADPERYRVAIETALESDSVDSVITLLTPQTMTRPSETATFISECSNGKKPLLACFMGGRDVLPAREELISRRLPDYTSPERAVLSLRAMYDYKLWRERKPRVLTRYPVNRRRVERVLKTYKSMRNTRIGEVDAKKILKAYGFAVPNGELCTSTDQAVGVSDYIGYPVAMKIVSRDIIHKSDIGGVKINLQNAAAVRDAYDLMMMRIKNRLHDVHIQGVYVEEMASKGREVILGMSRDPQFGPMMMFGLGGIFVEVMRDVSFHLAPITKDEAMQMLEATRSYEYLKGTRGQTAVDMESIAIALQQMSQLVTDFPQIMEMDINPFIVGPVGAQSVAADARMMLSESWVENG
ncbi:MAG: acetate--CoA ligase family protein [Deltaproteobacteria bacterium]|nr:acetate--CoA ligase family protein [Deltaproteobacteria bacterium]